MRLMPSSLATRLRLFWCRCNASTMCWASASSRVSARVPPASAGARLCTSMTTCLASAAASARRVFQHQVRAQDFMVLGDLGVERLRNGLPDSLLRFSLPSKPHPNEEGQADGQENPDQAGKLAELSARLGPVLLLLGSYFNETPQC